MVQLTCLLGRFAMGLLLVGALAEGTFAQRQVQKILGPASIALSSYAARCAMDGDWAIVGAPGSNVVAPGAGQAFVYHRTNGVWQETQQLFASDGESSDSFGSAVAMDGDLAVISAWTSDDVASGSGSAYVFERVGNSWIERQKLLPSIPLNQAQFGNAVAIDGDRIVVGAWLDSFSGPDVGAAYIYERLGLTWTEVARLQPVGLASSASFGGTVSIDGDRVACGALLGRAVYVFQRSTQGVWSQQQKLVYTGNTLEFTANFGAGVALNGSTLFVTSEDTVGAAIRGGRTFVYQEIAGVWTETQTLTSLDVESFDTFAIVRSQGEFAIGVAFDDDQGPQSCALYAFKRYNGLWSQIGKVLANDGVPQQFMIYTPSLSGTSLMVGAPADDEGCPNGQNCNTGAVYFFDLAPDATQYGSCLSNAPCGNADNHGGCRSSTGHGAVLQASGSGSVSGDDLILEVRKMPPFTATLMFMGSAQGSLTLGSGQLVAFGGPLGLYRLGVQFADAGGVLVRPAGIVAYSQALGGLGTIGAGQVWNFQCWYRDIASPCGITNNLSNGLSVQFVP